MVLFAKDILGLEVAFIQTPPGTPPVPFAATEFECGCGQHFTPPIPFLGEGAHATERFLERATELIRTSDVANAAAFLGVPERTLADWYYDFLQRRPNPTGKPLKAVRRIGIDELRLKKN